MDAAESNIPTQLLDATEALPYIATTNVRRSQHLNELWEAVYDLVSVVGFSSRQLMQAELADKVR